MRLFILFIPLLLFSSLTGFSQRITQFKDMGSAQKKLIKKQLKSRSPEEKILSFIILKEQHAEGFGPRIGGIISNSDEFTQATVAPDPFELLSIANLSEVNFYDDLHFPAKITRDKSGEPLPEWLPGIFGTNYVTDLSIKGTPSLFYGLDTTSIYIKTTAYVSWDDLLPAIIDHDLVYTTMAAEALLDEVNRIILTKQQVEALNEKSKVALVRAFTAKVATARPFTKQDILQWIWHIYRKSIDDDLARGILPLQYTDGLNICSFSFDTRGFDSFTKTLNRHANIPVYTPGSSYQKDLKRLSAYDMVILPISTINEQKTAFIAELAQNTTVLVAFLGEITTELQETLKTLNVSIVSISENHPFSQRILAETIFGAGSKNSPIEMLTVGVPELVGVTTDSLAEIDNLVATAIQQKAIPGCQILVAKDGVIIMDKAYGYQTYDSILPVTTNTLYDLASITKVLATTQGIMYLLERDSISLDTPLSNYLSYLKGTNKENISIRQIMAHQAGLYPYFPFWKKVLDEMGSSLDPPEPVVQVGRNLWTNPAVSDSLLHWAAISDLLVERVDTITHEQYMYSDIGFYLLKDLIEQKTNQPFDKFLSEYLYQPLGTSLVFKPTCYFPDEDMAPTENDCWLRHELVQGFVHDRNAALMGGVAGQAGLFGNANDVATMLQLQLNGGHYGGRNYFKSATTEQFITRQYDNNRRGLGWDMPGTEPDGPVSELASDQTFGHTGFTGASIWADPKESLIFVFLSNRIYPSVENTKLIEMNIRTRIQDIVYEAIIK
jgi:CubicO group peptidase (beta-lactamase class C family)